MKVSVTTPEEYMGDVMGDLNARRGRLRGRKYEAARRRSWPTSRCRPCSVTPRPAEQNTGQGSYSMEPSHYVELPKSLQDAITGGSH